MKAIRTATEYSKVMAEILSLMNKGEANITTKESTRIRELALAAQNYEQQIYTISLPATLEGMIEMKMYEKKMNQVQLAEKLDLSPAKLSLILNGKQKPDLKFLKKIRIELEIDADFILDHV